MNFVIFTERSTRRTSLINSHQFCTTDYKIYPTLYVSTPKYHTRWYTHL